MKSVQIRGKKINYIARDSFFQLAAAGKWEKETFDVLDNFIEKDKTFVDCGAWVGVFSIYAAHLGAGCLAIEPDNKAFTELSDNIHANGMADKIEPLNIALADKEGFARLNTMSAGGFGNSETSLIDRGEIAATQGTRTVDLPTLLRYSNVAPADICLIKIDIEGGELLLLDGCHKWLAKHKPTIYISFHPAWLGQLDEATDKIISMLFPIYAFVQMDGMQYNEVEFREAMLSAHNHSFLLIGK